MDDAQTALSDASVAVIGLGAMGMGVASSLCRAGARVMVFDLRPEAVVRAVAAGAIAAQSPAACAAACTVIISVVVNAAQTEQVLFGANGAASKLRTDSVFVMCSTVARVTCFKDENFETIASAKAVPRYSSPCGAFKSANGKIAIVRIWLKLGESGVE